MPTAIQRVEAAERKLFRRLRLDVEKRNLRVLGINVRVLEFGEGRPLVCLHGLGEVASQWAPLAAELEGRRVIAADLPGFGLSQGFDFEDIDLRAFAVDFTTALLDELDIDTAPVGGNSLGGSYAMWTALDAADRVQALALLGSPVFTLPGAKINLPLAAVGVPALNRFILNLPVPPLRVNRAVYKVTLGRHAIRRSGDELVEIGHHAMDRPTFAPSVTSLLERTIRFQRPKSEFVLDTEELAELKQPTLFVWGEDDSFGPPRIAKRAAAAMPDARVEVVPGGHNPWLDEPRRCADLLAAFLEDHDL